MRIELLFPDACYLGGDTANFEYLCRALPEAEAISTGIRQRPAFADGDVDLVLLGTMTERAQCLARDALAPHLERLRELVDGGARFLITGNAVEVFGQYIEDEDGGRTDMLGLFGYHARRRMMARHNSLYLGEFEGEMIVGFKSQFGHCYGCEEEPLFRTLRGVGFNPDVKDEGFRKNNFLATYLLGPILVMNPPFMRYMLDLLGAPDAPVPFEDAARDAYDQRVREFQESRVRMID